MPDQELKTYPWMLFLWHGLAILAGGEAGSEDAPLKPLSLLPYPLLQDPGSAHVLASTFPVQPTVTMGTSTGFRKWKKLDGHFLLLHLYVQVGSLAFLMFSSTIHLFSPSLTP